MVMKDMRFLWIIKSLHGAEAKNHRSASLPLELQHRPVAVTYLTLDLNRFANLLQQLDLLQHICVTSRPILKWELGEIWIPGQRL
jgi:hypothetical protein